MNDILSNLIINRIYSVTTMFSDTGASHFRKNRKNWAIVIKYEGETIYNNCGKTVVSNSENAVILPRGSSYDWICTKAGHYACVEFECDISHHQIISFHSASIDAAYKIFKHLEYRHLQKHGLYQIESIRDTYSIILKLAESFNIGYVSSKKSAMIAPAVEFMLSNYTEPVTNDKLAALCSMSTVYFRKLFKEIRGVSPIEYLKLLKIKKAKEMLHGDYGSLTDIAFSLGYKNIYDFSRDFKKRVGIPPSKYTIK